MISNEINISQIKNSLFRQGWVQLNPEFLGIKNKVLNQILEIKQSEYIHNQKNLGVLSLPQDFIANNKVFQEITENKKIIEICELLTGRKLRLTTIMQMLTIGKTKSLQWHRDSYCRGKDTIGPIPQVFKIMLFNKSISIKDGPFQVISGSHVLDLNNRYFDKSLPFLRASQLKSFINNQKKCILFDGRILHRRLFSKRNGRRSITILSLESPFTNF